MYVNPGSDKQTDQQTDRQRPTETDTSREADTNKSIEHVDLMSILDKCLFVWHYAEGNAKKTAPLTIGGMMLHVFNILIGSYKT